MSRYRKTETTLDCIYLVTIDNHLIAYINYNFVILESVCNSKSFVLLRYSHIDTQIEMVKTTKN